jgi:hypothetical protein
MRTWKATPILALIAGLVIPSYGAPKTPVELAFGKLQALAGDWSGKDEHGGAVTSRFEPVAGNTAVMESLKMADMGEDMLTLYSVDQNSIVLMHYCPTNNQPKMRATPGTGAVQELVFSFEGAGNLPDTSAGHEHKLVIQFEDMDHITERWTWRRAGKDTEMVFHLARTKQEPK